MRSKPRTPSQKLRVAAMHDFGRFMAMARKQFRLKNFRHALLLTQQAKRRWHKGRVVINSDYFNAHLLERRCLYGIMNPANAKRIRRRIAANLFESVRLRFFLAETESGSARNRHEFSARDSFINEALNNGIELMKLNRHEGALKVLQWGLSAYPDVLDRMEDYYKVSLYARAAMCAIKLSRYGKARSLIEDGLSAVSHVRIGQLQDSEFLFEAVSTLFSARAELRQAQAQLD